MNAAQVIDLTKFLESIPRGARKKLSLSDIHEWLKNYNGGVQVDPLKPDTHETMTAKLQWLASDAAKAGMLPLAQTLHSMADQVAAGA